MDHRRHDRRMVPAAWLTRCVRAGEIHEFVLCQPGARREEEMNHVSYLGFAEILSGGVVVVGDELRVAGQVIGAVHGFDETHFPNHYNVLVASERLVTGAEIGLDIGQAVVLGPVPGAGG